MIDTTGETDAVKDMVEWFLERFESLYPRYTLTPVFYAEEILHREFSDKNITEVNRAVELVNQESTEWWSKLLNPRDYIRPNIKALVARGNVTFAELNGLRCNSWEWEALVPAMNDEAFVDRMKCTLSNCGQRRDRPCTTYDQSLQEVYVPELIKRYESRLRTRAGLTHDELNQACKNIGFDLTCGACAELFFTGSMMHAHDETCGTLPRSKP